MSAPATLRASQNASAHRVGLNDTSTAAANPASGAPPTGGGAAPGRKAGPGRRWKPFGADFAKSIGLLNLITLVALLYGSGEYMSRPLHHLRGSEVTLDVLRVVDGDTFIAVAYPDKLTARFRLRRIDAPELAQPFGPEAKEALEAILGVGMQEKNAQRAAMGAGSRTRQSAAKPKRAATRKSKLMDVENDDEENGGGPLVTGALSTSFHNNVDVTALIHDADDNGRYVVDVVVRKGLSMQIDYVQEVLARDGWAWAFQTFGGKGPLGEAAEAAKAAKRGLWSDHNEPVAPWKFRQRNAAAAGGASASTKAAAGGAGDARGPSPKRSNSGPSSRGRTGHRDD